MVSYEIVRWVLFGVLCVYVVMMGWTMARVRKTGRDPKGKTDAYSKRAKASSLFSVYWVGLMLVHALVPASIAWFWPFSFMTGPVTRGVGVGVVFLGAVVVSVAMATLGESFRVGFPRENDAQLVDHGIYGWSRNPIVLAVYLLVGFFLTIPNVATLACVAGNVVTLAAKVRDEERGLAARFGDAWTAYKAKTRKYL